LEHGPERTGTDHSTGCGGFGNPLCRTYWYPLYGYVRRQGLDRASAQDLTQDFFAHLLEKNALETVDRAKGKFRSFLLASLKNFLSKARTRANATALSAEQQRGEPLSAGVESFGRSTRLSALLCRRALSQSSPR